MIDFMNINVEELTFDCVLECYQDEIVDPESGEVLRKDFAQSGHKVTSQYPELYMHEFLQGGGPEYALGRPGGTPPSTSFVLFLGDIRVAFRVTSGDDFAQDGITRLWEVNRLAGIGVRCWSPFGHMLPMQEQTKTIASAFKFESREQQTQIVAIIIKALSSYNHSKEGRPIRLDGKKISEKENKERIELLLSDDDDKYFEIYTLESWMEKIGPAEVSLHPAVISDLEKGRYIA